MLSTRGACVSGGAAMGAYLAAWGGGLGPGVIVWKPRALEEWLTLGLA
jgi:hypothetical protein